MYVSVQGGTNAGCRRVRGYADWECACPGETGVQGVTLPRVQPGHRYSCPECGARRDESE